MVRVCVPCPIPFLALRPFPANENVTRRARAGLAEIEEEKKREKCILISHYTARAPLVFVVAPNLPYTWFRPLEHVRAHADTLLPHIASAAAAPALAVGTRALEFRGLASIAVRHTSAASSKPIAHTEYPSYAPRKTSRCPLAPPIRRSFGHGL
ncbi:hypothetical protein B0H11DRAFT_2104464 [Mycena galericulata]|nr:hypothetical protein B0H11DRAFT_2104464 [Mycena galericulata]